ncbi:MAG: heavy-metal-associated domain-containing protein [Rhodospirillaceae bacterium]|jgi:copper chaperone|nr:heavy-metal-associated domain-containing protein [Rhodospirillaceae bacterium]MBT5245427.1 heavy-metal-associated domain-containing protein [Rhodospirillaceae bacterium]MBT5562583.1 heavy-metal-associated domain-containing protein [Rhodospirillaceae bacterium]MBT6242559.1 heavy-metal-associated domain-containing protein [Rhodospirillaceae bacterium]MBT7137208.1 heavy-metal-associated domain-containing protein [Rhodospirillaceae bacterium]
MSATYSVLGMTCQGCANAVTNAIKTAAPQSDISVNLDAKQITVDGCDDQAVIAQAVDDAGFEFAGSV